ARGAVRPRHLLGVGRGALAPADHPRLRAPGRFRRRRGAGGPRRERGRSHPGRESEEHTSELQSRENLVCRLLLEKKKQLRTVARLINAAPQLGLKRQIFFARLGGWDLHDAQLGTHSTLYADVTRNLSVFYRTTVE